MQVPFDQVDPPANMRIGTHQAEGMIDRLSKPQPGFADGNPLGKCTPRGKIPG